MGIKQSARYTCYLALMDMENGGNSSEVIRRRLNEQELSSQDRAFATRIFYGVLERKNTLDFYLAPYLRKTPDIEIMIILRMAIYQVKYMEVPDPAVLDESVKMCPAVKKASAKGFVNGVMRGYLREPHPKGFSFIQPITRQLSIEYSCDENLAKLLIADWGEEKAREILASGLDRAPIYIRVNPRKIQIEELEKILGEEGIANERTLLENSLRLTKNAPIERLDSFQKGYYHVQDLSSQLCCEAFMYGFSGGKVLDLCSAPGGKTFTIAEEMGMQGTVTAFDLNEHKTKLIEEGKNRLGLSNISIEIGDAGEFKEELVGADRVLCDVPCSGFGVIGKKPEIKYKHRDEYRALPITQLKILENASRYVKEGGVLIYSTCTLVKSENENVAMSFLKRHLEFEPHILPPVLEKSLVEGTRHLATIMPNDFSSDGFFIGAFRRKMRNE